MSRWTTYTESDELEWPRKKLPDFRKVLYMALSAKAIVTQTLNILRRDYDNDDGSISLIMNPSVDDGYESSVTFDSQ